MSQPANSPRERILRSARTLFASKGYEHASTSAIAREAGTSESQMMKYFGSKLGLLQAIFEEAWIHITAAARAGADAAATGPDKVRALLGAFLDYVRRDPELELLFLLEGRRVRREDHAVSMSKGYIGFVELFDGVLADMRREGSLRGQLDPQMVRSAIFGMTEGLLRDHFLYERLGFPAAYKVEDVPHMLDLVLRAFTVSSAAPVQA
ncbi:MAG TPA: TetR/AcrR family transcriptional regulator [Bryobacteraceae bacterium]|nr:TetR/AcrR family transcriptional regulator [Bryobacteraceae bacterium]